MDSLLSSKPKVTTPQVTTSIPEKKDECRKCGETEAKIDPIVKLCPICKAKSEQPINERINEVATHNASIGVVVESATQSVVEQMLQKAANSSNEIEVTEVTDEPIRVEQNPNMLKDEFKKLWNSYDPLTSFDPELLNAALADLFCHYTSLPAQLDGKTELEKAIVLEAHIDKLKNAALKLRVFTASTESKKTNILAKLKDAERAEFKKHSKNVTSDLLKKMDEGKKKVEQKEKKKKDVSKWKAALAEIADDI